MIGWLVWILVPVFGVACLLALVRILRGPSVLDRVVAADVLVATIICGIGAEMAINHHAGTLPVALGLALFAVFGSISVAKFMANREED
ncbi:monovalent cation/H+ antiporter complex subunit F [Rathayibacter agropyri]|uniref:monovalent cation/H+ antiporter complex subunit F n=1 Tax=Rathayibacter agropyri TaxID=1634927 RepID=UPI00156372C9|nr:monovalent cation/H+ antiporter complex subunit F [Rathayibacter agropyri]NRD08748.1 sodium:proton antiporter [Rathayibacter agropyri]